MMPPSLAGSDQLCLATTRDFAEWKSSYPTPESDLADTLKRKPSPQDITLVPHTRDSTMIVVAQRVSTIAGADQILVLEDGMVVGLGTHDELVAGCPTYAEIVASQLSVEANA